MTDEVSIHFFYTNSMKYSQELLRTASLGASVHSDKDSIGRYVAEGGEPPRVKTVSVKMLYSMVRPDWVCGLLGTIGALASGAEMPLFALGVTQALVSYYMGWETTKMEVRKIALLFCGGAIIALFVHVLAHFNFGIMGERLTLRVRQRMFGGNQDWTFDEFHVFEVHGSITIIIVALARVLASQE